jgi:tellurite resistance protein
MLTNTEHTLSIVNLFNKPELIFHSQAEEVKRDLKNTGKAVGGMFGKLFKTKKHKVKQDKKNEIKLMIHLSKADGIIEDEEKSFLADKISTLDDFTASEKQVLFDLMNMRDLPALIAADVVFSTPEKGKEVVADLIKLASADGELESREQKLIDDITSLMK